MRVDIPLDVELEIAMWIPDFFTLHSFILVARTYNQLFSAHRLSIAKAVAHNHFGEHLRDVLRLANTLEAVGYRQRPRKANNCKNHKYKSAFIRQLLCCEESVNDIHLPVFETLVSGEASWLADVAYPQNSVEKRTPSATERARINRAAYRFWTYCCIDEKYAKSYFSKFGVLEVLEMAEFEIALECLVDGMWGDPSGRPDPRRRNKISGVVSCGLGTISEIGGLFRALMAPEDADSDNVFDLFSERLGVSCENYGFKGGFFRSALFDFLESENLDADFQAMFSRVPPEPLLDEKHEMTKQMLSRLQEEGAKKT